MAQKLDQEQMGPIVAASLQGFTVGTGPDDIAQRDPAGVLDADSVTGATIGTGPNDIVQLDGSGLLPVVDGSNLTNLPSGTPPGAFHVSAYAASTYGMVSGAGAAVQLDTTILDPQGDFNTGLYRYTPSSAGVYQVSFNFTAKAIGSVGTQVDVQFSIRKNGSGAGLGRWFHRWAVDFQGTITDFRSGIVSGIVPMNGTTDYIDIVNVATPLGANFQGGSGNNHFYAVKISD